MTMMRVCKQAAGVRPSDTSQAPVSIIHTKRSLLDSLLHVRCTQCRRHAAQPGITTNLLRCIICYGNSSLCLSVCLSVCPSHSSAVSLWHWVLWILSKPRWILNTVSGGRWCDLSPARAHATYGATDTFHSEELNESSWFSPCELC